MNLIISWTLPIKTVSEANSTEHWSKKHKRHKLQKNYIDSTFVYDKTIFPNKLHIKLIRISPRKLDGDDNLPICFKYIKDYIASNLRPGLAAGRADEDKDLSWEYHQEKGKPQAIRIEFYSQD